MQARVITRRWRPRIALVCLLLPGSAQQVGTADQQQELTRLGDQWRTARINGDAGFLETLYAPELRITGTGGSIIDRDTDIAGFRSEAITLDSIEREDMRILVYGDAAIVIGRDNLSGRYNGVVGAVPSDSRTSTYAARDAGRWWVTRHWTQRSEPAAPGWR